MVSAEKSVEMRFRNMEPPRLGRLRQRETTVLSFISLISLIIIIISLFICIERFYLTRYVRCTLMHYIHYFLYTTSEQCGSFFNCYVMLPYPIPAGPGSWTLRLPETLLPSLTRSDPPLVKWLPKDSLSLSQNDLYCSSSSSA